MRIGIITRWNATCGVSMHAEMITEEFMKKGNDVLIFAPYIKSADKWWHHRIIREDEDFVIRCYNELNPDTMSGGYIDFDKIRGENFDVLLVESYTSIPYKDVEKLVKEVKKDGVKVGIVVHEGSKEEMMYSSLSIFDFVAVFDERYKEMLDGYGGNIRVVPYPCHPVKEGNRTFGEDGIVFFSFGRQPEKEYEDFVEALKGLKNRYDFVYKIIRSDGLLKFKEDWIEQKQERIASTDEVYRYLHSSDIHLLPKGHTNKVVVSSTLCQCVGSLIPTIAPDTRHFEMLPEEKPVILYRGVDDLREKIVEVIEDEDLREEIKKNAKRYVEENKAELIAKRFLDLFREVEIVPLAL